MSALESAAERPDQPEPSALTPEPLLPEHVRQRVISLASAAIGSIPSEELPHSLRRIAKFAPARRAKLGGATIAAQLSTDALLRSQLAHHVIATAGDLGVAVMNGASPAAADPIEVAALAYLARPEGWQETLAAISTSLLVDAASAESEERRHQAEQKLARAEHERTTAKAETDKLRDEVARLREEAASARNEARLASRALRESQTSLKRTTELLAIEKGRAVRAAADHDAELRRLRTRLTDAELAAGAVRQSAKGARAADDARLWLLLETIGRAAVGVKRELALDPPDQLPADLVAEMAADRPEVSRSGKARALAEDDPIRLDRLLALPQAHLMVDGYNVTKRGFGEMSLEQQRRRLVAGLGGLAAQTRAEVTVVFDGAERVLGLPRPRGECGCCFPARARRPMI